MTDTAWMDEFPRGCDLGFRYDQDRTLHLASGSLALCGAEVPGVSEPALMASGVPVHPECAVRSMELTAHWQRRALDKRTNTEVD